MRGLSFRGIVSGAMGMMLATAGFGAGQPDWRSLERWSVPKGRVEAVENGVLIASGTEAVLRSGLPENSDLELRFRVAEGGASVYVTVPDARGAIYISGTRRFPKGEHTWRISPDEFRVAFWSHDPDHHLDLPSPALSISVQGDAPGIVLTGLAHVTRTGIDPETIETARRLWRKRLAGPAGEFPPPAALGGNPAAVTLPEEGEPIVVRTPAYEARLDPRSGVLREIRAGAALWRQPSERAFDLVDEAGRYVRFPDPPEVGVGDDGVVRLRFDNGEGQRVVLAYRFGETAIAARLRIANEGSEPLTWLRFPAEAALPMSGDTHLIWPRLGGVRLNVKFLAEGRRRAAAYPSDLFSDFLAMETPERTVAFGVAQDGSIFQPANQVLSTLEPGRTARFEHEIPVYVPRGAASDTATFAWWVGPDPRAVLNEYAKANGFDRIPRLLQRIDRVLYARLQRMALLKVGFGRPLEDPEPGENVFTAAARRLASLPAPMLLHPVTYWEPPGRGPEPDRIFDKNYPNFLPANAEFGGNDGFRDFVKLVRRRGHYVMPYTNVTAWDRDAKGFEAWGDGIAVLLPSGARATGWGMLSACMSHPTVRRVSTNLWTRFRDEIGVDLIFEDQVGARSFVFDLNPEAVHPAGYNESMLRHAEETQEILPMYTERGFDALTPYVSGFCGIELGLACTRFMRGWKWDGAYGEGSWEVWPLAEFLMHDRAFFYHHDLGQFVFDRWDLGWSLARGTHLQTYLGGSDDWLWIVALLQQQAGATFAGEPLERFETIAPEVTESVFGRDTRIVVNHSRENAYTVDERTVLPPGGFLLVSDGQKRRVVAGWTRRYMGQPTSDKGPFILVEELEEVAFYDPLAVGLQIRYRPVFREKPIRRAVAYRKEGKGKRVEIPKIGEDYLLQTAPGFWRISAF